MQEEPGAALDPSFYAGRFLVEITSWDCALYLELSRERLPPEAGFQGDLVYSPTIEIKGKVLAPRTHKDKPIRVGLTPFDSDVLFGPEETTRVGQFNELPEMRDGVVISASLYLPKEAWTVAAVCLASVWKYVHIWVADEPLDHASITGYSFSRELTRAQRDWTSAP